MLTWVGEYPLRREILVNLSCWCTLLFGLVNLVIYETLIFSVGENSFSLMLIFTSRIFDDG